MTDYFAANDMAAFALIGGTPSELTVAGRYDATYAAKSIAIGSVGMSLQTARFIDITTGANANPTDVWVHFDLYGSAAGTWKLSLINSAGVDVVRFTCPTNGLVRAEYWDGAAWQIAGTTAAWPSNDGGRHTYDWHVVCGAAGSITLFGDQSGPYITSGALNAAVTNVASFRVEAIGANGNLNWSQFLVSDASTVGAKVASLTPNSNSATNTAWANDFNNLVKLGYNDATLVSSATLGDKESYGATDVTLPTASYFVSSVFFALRARLNSAAPANVKPLMRIGGVDYVGSYNIPGLNSAAFAPGIAGFAVDPSTGAAWAGVTNLNAAELGFVTAT